MLLMGIMILSACGSVKLDNSKRLTKRSDFEQVRIYAPEWARDALKTINYLESEIESQ